MARRSCFPFLLHHPEKRQDCCRGNSFPHVSIVSLFLIPLCSCVLFGCSSYSLKNSTAQQQTSFTLSISPSASQITAGQSVQFVATVVGNMDTSLSWAVDGVAGGNATTGTVSSTGLYLAPSAAPVGGSATISVSSQAPSSMSASALVSIKDTLTISPASKSISVGSTLQFTATLNGVANSQALWSVSGVSGGNIGVGTISVSGLYTAPSAAPSSSVNVSAVDPSDSLANATAMLTVLDPAVVAAHNQWLADVAEVAASYGCTNTSVQQQETESIPDVIVRFGADATEGSCLILRPISTNPAVILYSQAWGGMVDGKDILYISDIGQLRIWNAVQVTGD